MTKVEKLFAAADKRDKQKMYSIIAFFAILAVSHSLYLHPHFFEFIIYPFWQMSQTDINLREILYFIIRGFLREITILARRPEATI